MISYSVYKVIHLVGVLMVFLAVGGLATHAINGGARVHSWKNPIAITHGIGLFLSLLGGFGLLARLGIVHGGLPGWAIAKLVIWGFFGALLFAIPIKPQWAKWTWPSVIFLGTLEAYLAGSKSF
jgi:hypothetical protein